MDEIPEMDGPGETIAALGDEIDRLEALLTEARKEIARLRALVEMCQMGEETKA